MVLKRDQRNQTETKISLDLKPPEITAIAMALHAGANVLNKTTNTAKQWNDFAVAVIHKVRRETNQTIWKHCDRS